MNTATSCRVWIHALFLPLALMPVWAAAEASAQPPNYGHDFVTVDAPHNRRPNRQEAPNFFPPIVGPNFVPPGRVNHRYRIGVTEVSVRQWFEFVVAYGPYWEGSPSDPAFTSDYITYRQGSYRIAPGSENFSANMSWHNAARYVNWHCNAKRPERSAFEDGAYDTSTFTINPNGSRNDQLAHRPGSAFWIPTWDEWVKAAYYDPNRYGLRQEGYWFYPNGQSDRPLISGYPSQGGETSSGIQGLFSGEFPLRSYPHVQSPWGLLDLSGGATEWTETIYDDFGRYRSVHGSQTGGWPQSSRDRLTYISGAQPWSSGWGLRLASQVPSASTSALAVLVAALAARRRRRT